VCEEDHCATNPGRAGFAFDHPPEESITLSAHELKALLDAVADTRELVLRRAAHQDPAWNALYSAWSDAHEETEDAYRAWRARGDAAGYAAYRAAADREDAAQDALAGGST
jgi:hypothetical protein